MKPKKYKRLNIINIALTNQTSEHPRNRTVHILSNTALTTQTLKTSEKVKQSKCDIKKIFTTTPKLCIRKIAGQILYYIHTLKKVISKINEKITLAYPG